MTLDNLKKADWFTAFVYWFSHFSVEVVCFFILGSVFGTDNVYHWLVYLVFDVFAFATQPVIGTLCEMHPDFKPGICGGLLLIGGGALTLLFKGVPVITFAGLLVFTLGNAFIHISGALATGRVSEGRLSESAVFVGGGSFGVITGRLLSGTNIFWPLIFVPAIVSMGLMYAADRRIRRKYGKAAFDFYNKPVRHNIAKARPTGVVILILAGIVIARGFIGYGLPTGWNVLNRHLVFLFVFMGLGKMLGGILSDVFGARKVGIVSCIAALPILLVSNNIMWLSLIGISLFSMTMAVTLGGLFSVMPYTPGTAFGVTTVGLLLGSLPVFFVQMPSQLICNILNIIMSVFASVGIWYTVTDKNMELGERKNV